MDNKVRVTLLAAGCMLALSANAANLITNPDFTNGLDGWSVSDGDGTDLIDDSTGLPSAPSLRLIADGTTPNMSVESACMPAATAHNVDLYMNIMGTSGFAIASINAYGDTECNNGLTSISSQSFPANQVWDTYSMSQIILPPATRSAKVVLTAGMGSSADTGDINFDHIAFGPTGTLPTSVNVNQEGLTGTWYNPATSGQGMQFQFSPDDSDPGDGSVFGAWFTYDIVAGDTNSQRWYSIQGGLMGDAESAPVTIYSNVGGAFDSGPATTAEAVGSGMLTFDSCESGAFTYALDDGRSGTIPLQRLLPNINCVDSGTPTNPVSDFGFSGAWYNQATSGQGTMIEVNPSDGQAFLGWYTYAAAGGATDVSGQRWFSGQAPYTVGSTSIGMTVYASTGGAFDSSNGTVHTDAVGTATLTYTSCETATFDYTFTAGELNGRSGSIPLSRLGRTPVSCSFTNTQ
jgi:hypothetical protein